MLTVSPVCGSTTPVGSPRAPSFPWEAPRTSNQNAQSVTPIGWSGCVQAVATQAQQPTEGNILTPYSVDLNRILVSSCWGVCLEQAQVSHPPLLWLVWHLFESKPHVPPHEILLPRDIMILSASAASLNPAVLPSVCPSPNSTWDLLLFHLILPFHRNSAGIWKQRAPGPLSSADRLD